MVGKQITELNYGSIPFLFKLGCGVQSYKFEAKSGGLEIATCDKIVLKNIFFKLMLDIQCLIYNHCFHFTITDSVMIFERKR